MLSDRKLELVREVALEEPDAVRAERDTAAAAALALKKTSDAMAEQDAACLAGLLRPLFGRD